MKISGPELTLELSWKQPFSIFRRLSAFRASSSLWLETFSSWKSNCQFNIKFHGPVLATYRYYQSLDEKKVKEKEDESVIPGENEQAGGKIPEETTPDQEKKPSFIVQIFLCFDCVANLKKIFSSFKFLFLHFLEIFCSIVSQLKEILKVAIPKILITVEINWLIFCFSAIPANSDPSQMKCLNGIRVMSMAWVILGHILMVSLAYIDNPLFMFEKSQHLLILTLTNATPSVDTFFVLSGLLVMLGSLRYGCNIRFSLNSLLLLMFLLMFSYHSSRTKKWSIFTESH